ncbi:MAG: peptidoglycan-binding protein [Bryobacterales bacterium]|jgi:NTP pyrophosphatase (non-canonical NTP hydrolase)|nr:peptidoglycan-binding protein [Bryobacterales bacterium]
MPINQSIFIQASVGHLGRNQPQDVKTIQQRLNELMPPSRKKLTVDGKCGPLTVACIKEFQKEVRGTTSPDGRVDPNKGTLAALNDPASASKWAKMSFGSPAVPSTPGAGPGGTMPHEEAMRTKFKEAGRDPEFDLFRRAFVDGSIPSMKIFLGTIGRSEDALKLAKAYLAMRSMGLTFEECREVFRAITGFRKAKAALELFDDLAKPASKFGKLLGFTGKVAGKAGLLVAVIEIADKMADGDYLFGATEAYKIVMGKAIPWAAMIEGLQSLVEAVAPDSWKASGVFKVMRACDPIGLGATAVDAVTTLALGAIDMVVKGKMDVDAMLPRLIRLVSRMKQGPTKVFAEMGEDLGDAMYEISQWKKSDFTYAISVFPKWIASGL